MTRTSCSRGALLVFVALLLMALVGIVGLVLESGFMSYRVEQIRKTTERFLLEISGYYYRASCVPSTGRLNWDELSKLAIRPPSDELAIHSSPACNQHRFNATVTWAKLEGVNKYGLEVANLTPPPANNWASLCNSIPSNGSTPPPVVIPGFLTRPGQPRPGTAGTCPTSGEPCFDAIIGTAWNSNPQPAAYRFCGAADTYEPTNFGRIFGMKPKKVFLDVTVALIPRVGFFVVDVSPSVVGETHPRYVPANPPAGPVCGQGHAFGYGIDPGSATGAVVSSQKPAYDWLQLQGNRPAAPPVITLNEPPPVGTIPPYRCESQPSGSPRHYHNDYLRQTLLTDTDYGAYPDRDYYPDPEALTNDRFSTNQAGFTNSYYVDSYTRSNPEPLTSIMDALNTAIGEFQQRNVAEDRLGLIFVDSRLWWPRVVKLTSNFSYLQQVTDFRADSSSSTASHLPENGTTANYSSHPRLRAIRHGLFPSAASFSDPFLGLIEAINQMNAYRQGPNARVLTSNFIAWFTDGKSNCAADPLSGGARRCVNNVSSHERSYSEILSLVEDELVPGSIPVHTVLFGKSVGPHTLNIQNPTNPSGPCLTDQQYRAISSNSDDPFGFVDGTITGNPNDAWGSGTYYKVNEELYTLSVLSRGYFFPVRPKPAVCTQVTSCPAPVNGIPPRQMEDPSCLDPKQQLIGYTKQIIGSNPFFIASSHIRGTQSN